MENCGKTRAISLHVYSPPYVECGDGDELTPVVYCNAVAVEHKRQQERLKCQLEQQRIVYSNFQELTELLRKEIGPKPDIPKIRKMIENFAINPKEWKQYCKWDLSHYTRNLVAYDEHFTLLLLCWNKGQMSPIHDHAGSSCWVKVLEGELTEELYDVVDNKPVFKGSSTLLQDSVAYIDDTLGVHRMGNASLETHTITLHCYAPPYSQCHCYDEKTGQKNLVSMKVVNLLGLKMPTPKLPAPKLLTSVQSLVDALTATFATGSVVTHQKDVQSVLQAFQFNANEWQLYAHFDKKRYTRNLLAYNENFSLILLCWNTTQASPEHRHNNSASWMKVLEGELKITEYNSDHQPVQVGLHQANTVTYMPEEFPLHKTENASEENTAISLHVYSPPYFECKAGTSIIPVVYCSSIACCTKKRSVSIEESSAIASSGDAAVDSEADILDLQVKFQRIVYSNFQSLVQLLKREFETLHPCSKKVKKILESLQFHPREWQQYAYFDKLHYTRNLIAYDEKFTLVLICWNSQQESPIHNHGTSCSWVKILEGEIEETQYDMSEKPPKAVKKSTFLTDAVIYNDEAVVHKIANTRKDTKAVSIHLYSPPCDNCSCFDAFTGEKIQDVSADDLSSVFIAH